MKQAVICFTRVPKPGVTKTRLLPVLKPEQCAGLHWAFLKDLAGVYRGLNARLFVAYTPDPEWERLKEVFPDARYFPQEGADLGEKMFRAIKQVLEAGYESVVLTGSDLPRMGITHLQSGFSVLEEKDVVIGPTSDGGYYLIGMKREYDSILQIAPYHQSCRRSNLIAFIKERWYIFIMDK